MGRYAPYPEYWGTSDFEVPQVPRGWLFCPLKRFLTVQSGDMLPADRVTESGFPVVGGNGIRGYTDRSNTPAETIVIGRVGAKCGCVHYLNTDFWASEHAFRVLPRKRFHDRFMVYALESMNLNRFAITTAQPLLNTEIVTNKNVAIPTSLDEQQAIAAFLDHETAKIDRLIARQERLIELLKEKRQAVISHAVTKGLNPDAPMKDSGVQWLGEVPAHWDVARVKFVAKLESGHTPSKQVEEYWVDCDIPWVSLNDSKQLAQVDYISDTAYQINDKGLAGSSARLLPPGAVVFTRDATIGLTAITTREMAVSQHLIAWLPRERITSLFLLRVFNAMEKELDRFTFGATIKTIGMDDVKALTTTVPPLGEQEAICQYINERLSKFDLLVEKAQRQISLLREHRVSLISSAVTGKIDVRGWQKPNNQPQEAATAASA